MQNPATPSIHVSRCLTVPSLRMAESGSATARYGGIFRILDMNFREYLFYEVG
jgi:hypothetical protein